MLLGFNSTERTQFHGKLAEVILKNFGIASCMVEMLKPVKTVKTCKRATSMILNMFVMNFGLQKSNQNQKITKNV